MATAKRKVRPPKGYDSFFEYDAHIKYLKNCRYHPEAPKVKAGGGIGGSAGLYEYKCCGETSDIYKVLNGCKGDSGC